MLCVIKVSNSRAPKVCRMARTNKNFVFSMAYEMKFKAAIHGHRVYKTTWTPVLEEILICKKDNPEQAKEFDVNAVGVYKVKITPEGENLDLAGHVHVELSRILAGFLAASETNSLTVKVCCGKRNREVGLVVLECFQVGTKRKKVADILNTEIKRIKERYPYFELEIEQEIISKPLLNRTRHQINKLFNVTVCSVSFIIALSLEAIWGASIRHGAFTRKRRLIQTYTLAGAFIR